MVATLLPLLRDLVAVTAARGGVIVTGGTDAGVFHVLRLALDSSADPVRTIGVSPAGLVATGPAGGEADGAVVDGALDAIVLVDGDQWGDETTMLSRVVSEIAGGERQVVVVIGGGEVAGQELQEHLRRRRTVVVVEGSGRLADSLRASAPGGMDEELAALLAAGDVRRVKLGARRRAARRTFGRALAPSSRWQRARASMIRRSRARRRRWKALSVFPQLPFDPAPSAPLLDIAERWGTGALGQRIHVAQRCGGPGIRRLRARCARRTEPVPLVLRARHPRRSADDGLRWRADVVAERAVAGDRGGDARRSDDGAEHHQPASGDP